MSIRSHRDLVVWQKAMDLAVLTYRCASQLPDGERFGLSIQMRRAAVSVPANIAEGSARSSRKDYANFLAVAKGSAMELETHLLLAAKLDDLSDEATLESRALVTEVSKMLTVLRSRLLS